MVYLFFLKNRRAKIFKIGMAIANYQTTTFNFQKKHTRASTPKELCKVKSRFEIEILKNSYLGFEIGLLFSGLPEFLIFIIHSLINP